MSDPGAAPETPVYDPGYGPLVQTRVRVATWNLWGRYGPWEARMPVISENLRAIDADILGLTEVWEDDTRSQADELAVALGYTSPVYAPNLEHDGRGWATPCSHAGRSPATRCACYHVRAHSAPSTMRARNACACLPKSTGPVVRSRSSARI